MNIEIVKLALMLVSFISTMLFALHGYFIPAVVGAFVWFVMIVIDVFDIRKKGANE